MFRIRAADAIAALRDAIAELPSDLDARSEFFVQWRARTIQTLELIFDEDHEPVRRFKEIEFSPRLLTRNEIKDARLKLDAYLAGCASATNLLENLITQINTVPATPPAPPVQSPAQPAGLKLDTSAGFPYPLAGEAARKTPAAGVELFELVEPAEKPSVRKRPSAPRESLARQLHRIESKLDAVLASTRTE